MTFYSDFYRNNPVYDILPQVGCLREDVTAVRSGTRRLPPLPGDGQIPCAHFNDDGQLWPGSFLGVDATILIPAGAV